MKLFPQDLAKTGKKLKKLFRELVLNFFMCTQKTDPKKYIGKFKNIAKTLVWQLCSLFTCFC